MSEPEHVGEARAESERSTVRLIAAALAASPVVLLGLALVVPPPPPRHALVAPAVLAGFLSLAVGHRWYRRVLDGRATGAGPADRIAALRVATISGLACTGTAAIFGVFAFHFSREPFSLAGLAVHLILAGALWPTRARFERVLDADDDPVRRAEPM